MDTTTFANSIRTKYPDGTASDGRAYKDIPDAELADKIVQKYPVYKEQITDYKPYQANPSLVDTAKTRANAVMENPAEAAKGFVKGGIRSAVGVTKLLDSAGKAIIGATGVDTSNMGLDFSAVDEMTQYSNDAQAGGGNIETAAELGGGLVKTGVVQGVKFLAGKGAPIVKDAVEFAKPGFSAAKDLVVAAKNKLTNTGLSKTPEEILATPESQVHKLSQVERDYFKAAQKEKLDTDFQKAGTMSEKEFAAKQAQLEAEHNAITARANTELAANTAKSEKEIADFTKEVDNVAKGKTEELKPKAREVFSNQSKTYEKLIEEDLAPHADLPVTAEEISNVIKTALPDDPAMAEKLLTQAGKSKTVGELYQAIKNVKAAVSKGGRAGRTVMTKEDIQRDDVAAGLSDLLKEKGVDLSRANEFWSKWKPLQRKINSELKPFDFQNLETKKFSEILKSSGDDIHNQNFIKAFEDVLGEPITGETQAAMAKLSTAQKAKVAAEVDAKMAIEEAKLAKKYGMETIAGEKAATKEALKSAKQTAEEALKSKQFQIDRLAARKKIIKRVLQGSSILIGNKILKDTTGYSIPFVPTY